MLEIEENIDVEIIDCEPKYGESLEDINLREIDYVEDLYVFIVQVKTKKEATMLILQVKMKVLVMLQELKKILKMLIKMISIKMLL
jgi:hypothetical protein